MWQRELLILCTLSLHSLNSIEGESSADTLTIGTKDLANDLYDLVGNEAEANQLIGQTTSTASANSVEARTSTVTEKVLKKLRRRIVNGTKAVLGQFPQQVSLRRRYSQSHFCGGSILTAEWILTAGHCMSNNVKKVLEPYTITVVAGEIVLKNTNYARQWSYVRKIIVHPHFNVETLENDVALLQLSKPLTFDMYVRPITVASTSTKPSTTCQVSGWGYKKYEENVASSYLMYIDIPMMPVRLCRKLLVNYTKVPAGMLCAGYLEGGRDACQGDSGGGLLCQGFLTGVVSGGEGCAWPRLPGLYSDVKFYAFWIKQHVNLTQSFVSSNPISRASASSSLSSPLFGLIAIVLRALHAEAN
ncbi:PREDICTED: trypsin-like isoform X1 [Ceratosolen solmsi marchali]|uniref:Trypsin-like isoform X1 n=1 Tax=Ceratosolen solmsi marchali TaxID=326594 RepID=A0AAJ7DVC6_9HYME|nr:PREDICTED: trypsin-like isoform X1 [Ceratosolen solmsi marchali]